MCLFQFFGRWLLLSKGLNWWWRSIVVAFAGQLNWLALGNNYEIVPTGPQLAWSTNEFEVFIHFGVNSLSSQEWGSGRESAQLFNPDSLDARAWVKAISLSGASGVVLVCKHHDGFCLWPSRFTKHSVRISPWRGGDGDLVREVASSCREVGLRFGVYLSPSDLREASFGKDSAAYNEYFRNQLRELLTQYGEISQVWFDGAQPSQLRQAYDFPSYYRLVRELQPNAVIVSKGPDVRWVGNESGVARETEWSVIPLPSTVEDFEWPDMRAADLGSRTRLMGAQSLHWYPALCDVSLGPDWFWDVQWERKLKTLEQLKRIYETSIGRNAGLLLNVAPDRRGVLPENQVQRLSQFGDWIRRSFATNLLSGAQWRRSATTNAVETWECDLGSAVAGNTVVLQEDITRGQYVERATVEIRVGDHWYELAHATTIGRKRILRWPTRAMNGLRVSILETRNQVHLRPPELYLVEW